MVWKVEIFVEVVELWICIESWIRDYKDINRFGTDIKSSQFCVSEWSDGCFFSFFFSMIAGRAIASCTDTKL